LRYLCKKEVLFLETATAQERIRLFLPTDEMGIPRERMAVIETENAEGNKHRGKPKKGRKGNILESDLVGLDCRL
jgi:hypothetical protein